MQTIRIQTTQNVFIHYPLASVGDRILAYFIDRLIIGTFCVAVFALFAYVDIEIWWVWLVCIGFPYLFYSLAFEILMDGQTPGKRLMKIKVVRLNGTPASIGDYLLRWIFGFVDFMILGGAIAMITIAAGGQGQRIGDMVAGTTVVKLSEQKEISAEEIFIRNSDDYVVVFPDVISLSSRDIELITQSLEVNRASGNDKPARLVSEKIKNMLALETDMPPIKFLYTVIKDYNHLTSQVA